MSEIVKSIAKLGSISTQTAHASTEKLTIGLGSDLPKFLAPQIASFSQKHPNLQLTIVSKPFQTLSLLLGGTVDVAIGWFPHIPRMIQKRALFNSRLHLILPKDHPLGRKREILLEDTAPFRLILHSSYASARRVVDEAFFRNGIEINNALEVGGCESIVEYVVAVSVLALYMTFVCLNALKRKFVSGIWAINLGQLRLQLFTRKLLRDKHLITPSLKASVPHVPRKS